MENKKDIGKAISDKLNSLDKTPRENVWSGISYELQKKKKRRIGFFFFWTKTIGLLLIGAIAALYVYTQNEDFNTSSPKDSNQSIIINGTAGKANTDNSNDENKEVNDKEFHLNNETVAEEEHSIEKRNDLENKNSLKNGNSVNGANAVNSKSKKASGKAGRNYNSESNATKATKRKSTQFSTVNPKKSNKKAKGKSNKTDEFSSQSDIHTEQKTTTLFDPTSLQNINPTTENTKELKTKKTDSLITKKDKEKKKNINMYPEDKTEKDSAKGFVKFHVDAFVSPTHYGYFSKNSTLSRFLDSNSKTTEMELNYGAGLSYELTEKIAIRIGYSNIKLNYTTHDALVNTQNYSGIKYNPGINNEAIYTASNNAETMDILQNMSYNEITLEARYKFLDKKIGVNAMIGFSFLMLNDNTVNIKTSNGFGQEIGQTKGVFETGASVNIGFGLDYQVFKNTKLFMEPMFNYQAMSFENSNYKPYYFGLHFGVRYALINK